MESTEHVKTIRQLLGIESDDFYSFIEQADGTLEEIEPKTFNEDDSEEFLAVLPQAPVFGPKLEYKEAPAIAPDIVIEMPKRVVRKRHWFRSVVRYPLIFILSFAGFYLLFNFQAITAQIGGVFSPPPENSEALLGSEIDDFNKWIKKYYVHVSNKEVLSPSNDADGDGLTNMDEYKLGTNPLKADTDFDGQDDGLEVLRGDNPLYEGKLSYSQRKFLESNVNLQEVQARRNFDASFSGEVLGSRSSGREVPIDKFHVDTTREGRVVIPKIGVDAPLVWTKNFDFIQDDLKYGVAHHPNTVYPGQRGMASFHGHSSGYLWDGSYKYVFTKINMLEPGDEIFVTVYGTNGEERKYRYIVRSKRPYDKEDPGQFADNGGYQLNISTSWPIGSARERYVVTTELAGL